MTSIPQISGQRLVKACFTKRPREQVEYSHEQITPTITPGSAPKRLKELDEEHRVRQAGLLERWQLGRIKNKARGCPSFGSKYVEGLHKAAWLVSRGQCPEPSFARIWSEGVGFCPKRHRAQGFKVRFSRRRCGIFPGTARGRRNSVGKRSCIRRSCSCRRSCCQLQ